MVENRPQIVRKNREFRLAQFVPHVLLRIELGRMGRQPHQPDVLWHDQVLGHMRAGTVLTTWVRPSGTIDVPVGHEDAIAMESGVTYRNLAADYVFRYVLIHEMGHYLGLDHKDGTRWLDEIMYSMATGGTISISGVAEYLLLGGEARFTVGDAEAAWMWFTGDGATALFP